MHLDFHDSPADVLASMSESDLVKVAHVQMLGRDDLDGIPTNRFALAVQDGDVLHRKFLCDSPEHTLLSAAAFQKTAEALPEGMRIVAMANIQKAADLYGINLKFGTTVRVDSNVVVGKLPEDAVKVASVPDLEDCARQARWFDDFGETLDPRQRRGFAVKLASSFHEHHLPVPGDAAAYAGDDFGPGFEGGLLLRTNLLESDDKFCAIYRDFAKIARGFTPDEVAEALRSLDEQSGLAESWTRKIPDPYRTVFAGSSSIVKVASDSMVDKARTHEDKLRSTFGDRFYEDLLTSPEPVVDALPLPEREVLDQILGL